MKNLICIGMERSASTVTWQMVKHLLDLDIEKTHEYVSGDSDVVYTYRHPLEAYYSLQRCFGEVFPVSTGQKAAIEAIRNQAIVFNNLKEDEKNGRKVLYLKYEDYYDDPFGRLDKIREFLNVGLCDHEKILELTSIEKNNSRTRQQDTFGEFDKETGIHGSHIDPILKGAPGAIFTQQDLWSEKRNIFNDKEKLRDACDVFGYDFFEG
jgi:hypothetical protein